MYLHYFGLDHKPFAITPDPRYLFLSERHREALAHLLYGIGEGGGFVLLTGEVGTGKTTVCRALLEQVPENVDVALVLNPRLSSAELLATICDELGVDTAADASIKDLVDTLNRHLLAVHAAGRRTVVIIDEAQNLSADVIEQVRLLTNLETATDKLLQVFLIGQPELRELLAEEHLRQVAQRITARYHLEPLAEAETAAYIEHRLAVAGATRALFAPAALRTAHRLSGGTPRLVNILCDRALLGAYVSGGSRVEPAILRRAARELGYRTPGRHTPALLGILLLVGTMAGTLAYLDHRPAGPATAAAVAAPPPGVAETPSPPPAQAPEPEPAPRGERAMAEATLLRLWGVEPGPGPLCDQAQAAGLRCHQGSGNWNSLRRLNRPALLRLAGADGRDGYAVVSALGDERVTLRLGDDNVELDAMQAQRDWWGDYTLLWQPPIRTRLQGPGGRGADVAWVREALGLAAGDRFDAATRTAVEAFQRSHGLQVDGLVGNDTRLYLQAQHPAGPSLRPAGD